MTVGVFALTTIVVPRGLRGANDDSPSPVGVGTAAFRAVEVAGDGVVGGSSAAS